MVTPTIDAEVGHGDESGAVPTRSVDDAVHDAGRKRVEVPTGVVQRTLAQGLSVSGVREPPVVAVPARGPALLSVPGVPASDDAAQRHAVRGHQIAVDDLVSRDPSSDLDQDEHGRAGTEAASGCDLSHRLAPEAQGDGGNDAA